MDRGIEGEREGGWERGDGSGERGEGGERH